MIDVTKLLTQADAFAPFKTGALPDGQLIYNDIASCVVVPASAPQTVVKIRRPGILNYGHGVREEFEMMQKLAELPHDGYILPHPIACGIDPSYIQMSHTGDAIVPESLSREEIAAIGGAFGALSATTYRAFGLLHADAKLANSTRPAPGQIAIVDLAAIIELHTPEAMLFRPCLEVAGFAPAVAAAFSERTGHKFDFGYLEELLCAKLPAVLRDKTDEVRRRYTETAMNNVHALRAAQRQSAAPARKVTPPAAGVI